MQLSNSTKGILLALLGASAWGAMGVAGQNVLQHFSFTPWDLVSLRLLCAGSILLILLFLQRGKAALAPMQNKRDAFDITLCGIMIGVSQLRFFLALFAHRRVRVFEMGCMLCAVVGVTLLVTKGDLSSVHLSLTGCLWSLAAIITFIIYTLQPKRVMARVGGTTPVVSWGIFIGGVIACFINPPWPSHAQWTWESSLCLYCDRGDRHCAYGVSCKHPLHFACDCLDAHKCRTARSRGFVGHAARSHHDVD